MEQIIVKKSPKFFESQSLVSLGYMPRVYDVRAPCQWKEHCYSGKCPALTKINGNFYCAKPKQIHT